MGKSSALRLGAAMAVAWLAGCARGPLLERTIEPAAELPLLTFPQVWVATPDDALGMQLAQDVTSFLEQRARRVAPAELEPARRRGVIPSGTLVLRLVPSYEDSMETRTTERPETVCGSTGCYRELTRVEYEVPVVTARLEVFVHDGPSARLLDHRSAVFTEEGRDYAELRALATRAMAARLREWIRPEARTLRARLLPDAWPGLGEVFAAAEGGDLRSAREALSHYVGAPAFRALPPDRRAVLLYDLGQLWRFDPDAPGDALHRARELLTRAVRLDPRTRYHRALEELAGDEARARNVAAQREAAAHNFALGRAAAPPPPAGYEQPAP